MDKTINRKVETFFKKYKPMKFGKKEIILRPDEDAPGIYFLKSGLVRQYTISKTGEVLVMHIFRPGSFFQMMWAINNTPNSYYYEAIIPVEVWRAPAKDVQGFMKKEPEVLYFFTSRLLKGLEGLLHRIEDLVLDSAYTKTASLISYFAKNFGQKEKNNIVIKVPLTHREIAAWIGTARETASLQVETFKKKGLIYYQGRSMVVTDLASLEKEALQNEFVVN